MRLVFGNRSLDIASRQLKQGADVLRLSPRAFELLRLLVEARPRALAKEELLETLWPDAIVSESALAGLVAEIRRAIGDDAREPRFLRTVHGLGYAFADGGAARADEDAVFRLMWGLREVPLAEGENVLGRDADAAIRIDDPTVSRHHARIVIHDGHAALEDLGSKNGTWLRGGRVGGSHELRDGDEIQVGPAAMIFRCFASSGSTETQIA